MTECVKPHYIKMGDLKESLKDLEFKIEVSAKVMGAPISISIRYPEDEPLTGNERTGR